LAPILRELRDHLELDTLTVTGRTLGEEIDSLPPAYPQDVVKTVDAPLYPGGGMVILRGNLAPDGAVIKQSAANPNLLSHEGRALVFSSLEDMAARVDDPDLDVTADDVMVLQNAGPLGAPGMPEAGYLPIPKKLAEQGVKDMVRLSDARMSGTAFGTIILHVAPESAVGGPLALVETGDWIRLDVPNRSLELLVEDAELARRREAWTPPSTHAGAERGYLNLYLNRVTQAPDGCDFDFLMP
jgi:dihydroxy-acid dehydratase